MDTWCRAGAGAGPRPAVAPISSPAGRALNTLLVDDLDVYLAELAGRGIAAGPVLAHAGARHVTITDPDGNRLQLGQPHRSG